MFEWDPIKNKQNQAKHGISFEITSQYLIGDFYCLEARSIGEERYISLFQHQEKYWTTVFTIRDSKIRIISTRRAREEEIKEFKED